ncbi:hypothetical protein Y1Q_0012975 [Alligator mississippiensis]|uniref:Uncharacterized protein n=1 Tax=Alligator mississippiensis TaxID=8496 RepID=A0A151NVU1_ALLMI|nr:hypothetical protein Y1Q_0012975 [Alligator mississippiensis]
MKLLYLFLSVAFLVFQAQAQDEVTAQDEAKAQDELKPKAEDAVMDAENAADNQSPGPLITKDHFVLYFDGRGETTASIIFLKRTETDETSAQYQAQAQDVVVAQDEAEPQDLGEMEEEAETEVMEAEDATGMDFPENLKALQHVSWRPPSGSREDRAIIP